MNIDSATEKEPENFEKIILVIVELLTVITKEEIHMKAIRDNNYSGKQIFINIYKKLSFL